MIKYILYIVFLGALAVDYFQTRKILRSKDWTELNRILVWLHKHFNIEVWFLAWAIFPAVALYFLPNDYGVALAAFLAGTQTNNIWRNWRIGI